MLRRVELLLAACCYYSGLVKLFQWWTRRSGQRLVILNYHRAAGDHLRQHLLYLRRHYRILHLEEGLEILSQPPTNTECRSDHRALLALTFDDGYRDNYTCAFALARELQVPLTIFLIPGYVESGDYFWWVEGARLVRRARVKETTLERRVYHLTQPEECIALAKSIDFRLRYARSVKERDAFLASMRQALSVPTSVTSEEEPELPLTWQQIHTMQANGLISFGAHTMHHPTLSYLADGAEVEYEVAECRKILEQQLGQPIRVFAYPIGRPEHIGAYAIQAVQKTGYAWAVTTIEGSNTPQTSPYLLRRVSVDVDQHWLMIAVKASGLWAFLTQPYRRLTRFISKLAGSDCYQ